MASQNDLLELYRQHRQEIDIFMDEKALFVLALVQQLRSASMQELAQHLGWDPDELATICTTLQNAGMVRVRDLHDSTTDVELLPSGKDLLTLFYDTVAVGPIQPAKLSI